MTTGQISRNKSDNLHCTTTEFTLHAFDGYGLYDISSLSVGVYDFDGAGLF